MTKVPEIRFDGFEGEFKYTKLKNISEKITRKNTKLESNLPLTISAEHGLVNQLDYYNFRVASKNISSYYLIYNGEFAYNKSTSNEAPFGAIKRLDDYQNGVLSTLYIVFYINNSNSNFIKYYFETYYWCKHIYKISQEGARNHGLLNLNVSDFFEMPLKVPSNLYEQEKIGDLFAKIDSLIENQEELLEKTKDFKKSMLEKMFPKKDSLVPEFRFDGFNCEWSIFKVNELAKIKTGESNTQDADENGKYPFYIRSEKPQTSNKYLYDQEAVLTIGDGRIGKVFFYVNGKYDLHQRVYRIFDFKENLDGKYFYHYFSKFFLQRALSLSAKATVDSVRMEMISGMEIKIPNIEEQIKIRNFLESLDAKISAEEELLESYKKMKKSLLQKMFV